LVQQRRFHPSTLVTLKGESEMKARYLVRLAVMLTIAFYVAATAVSADAGSDNAGGTG
jgi:hypothetical protein